MVSESGALVLLDADLTGVARAAVAGGTAAVVSRRCPGRDGPNEDAAAVLPGGEGRAVLAVADGVGGHSLGHCASRLAVEHLADSVARARAAGQDLREGVLDGFESAHAAIRALGNGAATTLVVVELCAATARTYHAGDSMALVCGQRGRLRHRTVSHSPVGYGVEAGLIGERDAMVHEQRHLVSNALGSAEMRIEVGPVVALAARDTVLLASDGLWDNVIPERIVETVRKGRLEQLSAELADAASAAMAHPRSGRPGKPDDLTFVIWRPGRG